MKELSNQFNYFGKTTLMNLPKTVFFCPFDVTNDIFKYIREWVASLDPMADVIVCGNSTGIERFTLRLLLNKGFSVILPLATTIPENLEELNLGWKLTNEASTKILNRAFDEGRLLLVSSVENVSVSVPTKKTLLVRDEWMREVGTRFTVAAHQEFGYYDRLLLGKEYTSLSEITIQQDEDEEAELKRQQYATRMGWQIYRCLKKLDGTEPMTMVNNLLNRYLQLEISHPSLLHSLILTWVASYYSTHEGFDFPGFLRSWSIQNLRPEDWKGQMNKDGKFIPSLAERCVARLFLSFPSKHMMSTNYGRPFDTNLAHLWLDAAMEHAPKNLFHIRKALRLAYYERDGEKIAYYKQMLAV